MSFIPILIINHHGKGFYYLGFDGQSYKYDLIRNSDHEMKCVLDIARYMKIDFKNIFIDVGNPRAACRFEHWREQWGVMGYKCHGSAVSYQHENRHNMREGIVSVPLMGLPRTNFKSSSSPDHDQFEFAEMRHAMSFINLKIMGVPLSEIPRRNPEQRGLDF